MALERDKLDTSAAKFIDQFDKFAQRTAEAVKAPDHRAIARSHCQ
jgi:hypothetical protein